MKKYLLLISILIVNTLANAQAKKPTIMVVPSDLWCNQNNYMLEYDNQGTQVKVPNYKKALQENVDLLPVVAKIGGLMADRGFPLKDLEASLKKIESQAAEDAMTTSKTGAAVSESPIDKLKKTAKADIIIQLTWTINQTGPKKSITFTLKGLDSYTDKQIAVATGTGAPSFTAELPILLEEAVLAHLDNFNGQLQNHFDDMFANGREVTLRVKKFDSFSGDLESEYNGEELSSLIEKWVSENTVKGRFNTTDATENMMLLEQVRIPLYDANNKAVDTRGWAKGLQKYLKDTFQIENKLSMNGLGEAIIIVGEK